MAAGLDNYDETDAEAGADDNALPRSLAGAGPRFVGCQGTGTRPNF